MLKKVLNKTFEIIYSLVYLLYLKVVKGSCIYSPLKIKGAKYIKIGKKVVICYKSWIEAMPLTGYKPELVIDDFSQIGNFSHIYATKSIRIGKNVLIADKVYISDNLHGYEDVNVPVIRQPIVQKMEVIIGDDSWIGENVCIIGSSVGKHCVIGANSVVTKDIPDYCVAVGSPAKVIKKFDFTLNKWVKI